jgi:uncharacterized protein YbjQ (UPF0145 family)
VDEALSRQHVEAGGLPLRAQRRLQEMGMQGHSVFTSTLSPSEGVMASKLGVQAISQVMGSSMYHVGFGSLFTSWRGGELTQLTHAYEQARSRALGRMREEARLLGAHAVVDVRFEGRGLAFGEDLIEFTAIGTAVRLAGAATPAEPALTLLSVDELWKLHLAGYWPVAIAMGNCFWLEPHADCQSESSIWSAELPRHTWVALQTRHLAVERFRAFARHFNAHGVVGVRMHRKGHDREPSEGHTSFELEVMLSGTAVVRRGDAKAPPMPRLVVDVADHPRRFGGHGPR